MGASVLGAGNAMAKQTHHHQPDQVRPAAHATQPAAQPTAQPATYNLLSNNPTNEITLLKVAKASGLKGQELAQFMAQMKHESWDFERMKEKPQPGVKDYYSKKYDMQYSPKTAKILGNKHAGDGARYHGRGFVQLTGRDNYRMASDALGIDLLKNPDLAARPDVAAKVAVWYWNNRVKPGIQNFADTRTVTQKINPAAKGLEKRDENFRDYMRII
jgi:putative chitinase